MASPYLRQKCADQRPRSSATTPRRFLKVILDETSRDRKLGIPKSFLDNYGEDLSNWVHFKLPGCPEWEIGLTSYNGEVWFRKGWPEFSKNYSLEKGYSLLFGYEGDSRFKVSIFNGSNNTEIDYATKVPGSEETDQDDDMSLELSEDVRPTAPPLKNSRTLLSPRVEMNVNSEEHVKKEKHWSKSEMKTGKDHTVAKRDRRGTSTQRFRIQKQTPKLYGRAQSCNRSFRIPMCSTYINGHLLWLPKTFVQTYLVKQPGHATLTVSGGKKTWPVKLIYEEESKGKVKFQSGWIEFVRDKNLKVGDVCEFLLVDSSTLVLEVNITTANRTMSPDIDDSNDEDDDDFDEDDTDDESIEILDHFPPHLKRKEKSPLAQKIQKRMRAGFPEGRPEVPRKMHDPVTASSGKDIALQRANGFKSADPDFMVSIRPSYIHGRYLHVPAEFAKRHLVKKPSHAILQVADKTPWSVGFHYVAGKATLQSGWFEFLQDNELKEGDTCVFKLIDRNKFIFDVVFFPST